MHLRLVALLLLQLSMRLGADDDRVEIQEVSELKIELTDERVIFDVSLEILDREEIQEKKVGDRWEAWKGKESLPPEVLWMRPTIVRSFSLKIDGEQIDIPARFWNDLAGLSLHTIRLSAKEATPEDLEFLEESLSQPRLRPQVSRSANGGTVLITWARPEE